MAGIENNIGLGQAQVLPQGGQNPNGIIAQLQQGDAERFQRSRIAKSDADKKEKDLYGLIGDALNPKDFNNVIQDKVLQSQKELAAKIKTENPSYGEMYMMAQNAAGTLAKTSQSLNKLDQQIALTKAEYAQDKRINSGQIELQARKNILGQLNTTGTVDDSKNYFDEALNHYPEIGLVDKSDATFTDFKPEEKQALKFNVKKKSAVGKTNQFTWDFDNYPAYYDVKQNGEFESPSISVRSQPSGIKNANGEEVPMLSDDAYKRFSLTPSNVVALNRRIRATNPNIDLGSKEAETMRKIEAYKDVERYKPTPRESRVESEPKVTVINNNGNTKNAGGDWVKRATAAVQDGDDQKIQDEFAQLFQGDKNIFQSASVDNGKLKVTYKVPEKKGLMGNIFAEEPKTVELDVNDRYLSQKLANIYQTIMGGDVNVERTVYSQTKKPAQRTGARPSLDSFIKK